MYAMALFGAGDIWMILPVCLLTVVITAVLLERVAFRPGSTSAGDHGAAYGPSGSRSSFRTCS